jgi:hypothetical protein
MTTMAMAHEPPPVRRLSGHRDQTASAATGRRPLVGVNRPDWFGVKDFMQVAGLAVEYLTFGPRYAVGVGPTYLSALCSISYTSLSNWLVNDRVFMARSSLAACKRCVDALP